MWGSNMGSRACFEKNGFKLEGTLRESFFYRGTYVDEYILGLLRREWEEAQQAA
jgi:diamine N-acetyltransferase